MIHINAVLCKKCNYVVFSRSRHDLRYCYCKSIFIDGGFDYIRIGGDDKDIENIVLVTSQKDITKHTLYNDWSTGLDYYGLLHKNNIKEMWNFTIKDEERILSAENFVGTIAVNVNNKKMSDKSFRKFIRETLPIVIYEGR